MGDWYEIGVAIGIGLATGIALAGLLAGPRFGSRFSTVGAASLGAVAGLLVSGALGAAGGAVGGTIGALSTAVVVCGATRRGATVGATAFLLLGPALVVGLLALIPVVGYVELVLLPLFAVRRARREPEKYAGLRSLAK